MNSRKEERLKKGRKVSPQESLSGKTRPIERGPSREKDT